MRILTIGLLAAIFVTSMLVTKAAAEDWMLRVVTTSRSCNVQSKTAAPIGADFKGPFSSRKLACQEAKNQYDNEKANPAKCWAYGGGTVSACRADSVSLP
jgi:hypothetical protein